MKTGSFRSASTVVTSTLVSRSDHLSAGLLAYFEDVPPLVKFESRINLPCVDSNGLVSTLFSCRRGGTDVKVNFARIPSISNWKRDFTLETVLVELRRSVSRSCFTDCCFADADSDMASPVNRKNPQPQEGTEFPPMDLGALAKQKKV
jgi:ubiquitin-conjugating enzyme E2 variant